MRGWDRRNAYYFQLIRTLGAHYDFDVETPWQALPEQARKLILYGSGREKIRFPLHHERSSGRLRPFEGILPNMERRYRETDSNTVREGLARYISQQPCPDCGGSRLNQAARHVLVADHNLPRLGACLLYTSPSPRDS